MEKTTVDTEAPRAFRMSLDIDAPREDVWRALTEAEELVRWFPLNARVTPGQGGSMTWSWEDHGKWETRIDAWEPGRLLRLVQEDARPYDTQGRQLPAGRAEPARIAMEFTLETQRGKTRLSLVHSGFGHGDAWDNELDGISEGWQAELRSLRHYLEHHRGRNRHAGRAWLSTATPRPAAWARLFGPGGFRIVPAEPMEGERYEVVTPDGQRYTGTVELHLPGQTLVGTVRELDGGWFRLITWKDGAGDTGVWAWLSTYAVDEEAQVREFRNRAQAALERLFPAA